MGLVAPLRLDGFRLYELTIEGNVEFDPQLEVESIFEIRDIDFDWRTKSKDPTRHQLRLTVEIGCDSERAAYRRIRVSAAALFTMPTDAPQEHQRIMPVAPLSMIYGMIRGVIATLSGVGPTVYLLPSINFYEVVKSKAERVATGIEKRKPARIAAGIVPKKALSTKRHKKK